MKVQIKTKTDGKGWWSDSAGMEVDIYEIKLVYINGKKEFGELRAYFDHHQWNIDVHGLIYTDVLWMQCFRMGLVAMGFSIAATEEIDYSEQGMQRGTYVSMDVFEGFITEWYKLGGTLDESEHRS